MWLVEIEIGNNGGQPIEAKDIHEPIRVVFEETVELFELEVTEKFPADLQFTAIPSGPTVTVTTKLLNPKDRFRLKALVTSEKDPELTITARISGISQVKRLENFGEVTVNPMVLSYGPLLSLALIPFFGPVAVALLAVFQGISASASRERGG